MDSPVLASPAAEPAGAMAPLEFDLDHRPGRRLARLRPFVAQLRMPLAIYAATRVVYLAIALVDTSRGSPLINAGVNRLSEVTNWDGMWYVRLATQGYPHGYIATHLVHWQTTLGFFPLYSMVLWVVWHALPITPDEAGLLVAMVGGFAGVVVLQRLALRWWDEAAARRVVLFVCLFPGSIVFSMDYSEGLLIPLAGGCMLALEKRRWLIAGICAAFVTLIGPIGLAIIPACAIASGRELYIRGFRRAKASLLAPALSFAGVGGFAIFLWSWTGTPLASYYAQRYGWNEKSSPLAIPHDISKAYYEALHGVVNLNYYSGMIGTVFLLGGLWMMLRGGGGLRRVSVPAIAWTLWVSVLILTSWNTPPNPRMLLCTFPVLMVYAARLQGKAYGLLIAVSTVLLFVMSWLTYVGTPLRP
jgi:hypothetical protein